MKSVCDQSESLFDIVAVHFIPRIFYPGDSISHPGGYTDLSVKYLGSGYFIPGSHLASPR